jgi:hypothetical protein
MGKTISLIQRVHIASPCNASWDQMRGDDRSRFCAHCNLNVYNLSAMTTKEGERLIREKEGRLCVQIYRRRDGTILTQDCPVGLSAVRRRVVGFGIKVAAAVLLIFGIAASLVAGERNRYRYFSIDTQFTPSAYEHATHAVQRWLRSGQSPPQQILLGSPVIMIPYDESESTSSGDEE